MIINHLDKLFVTNDAATMIRELEVSTILTMKAVIYFAFDSLIDVVLMSRIMDEFQVEHPAAALLVMSSEQQSHEVGDGTNFVIIFAGMLLQKAEGLLRMVSLYILD